MDPLDTTFEAKRMTETKADYEVLDLMRVPVKCHDAYTIGDKVIPCELEHGHASRHFGHIWGQPEATIMWGIAPDIDDEDIPF